MIFCIVPQYARNMDESFFVSYRKTVLKHNEILVSLMIPWTQEVYTTSLSTSILHYQLCINSMNMCTVTSNHLVVTMILQ